MGKQHQNVTYQVKGMWWGVLEKGQYLQDNMQYYGDYNSIRYSYTDIKGKYSDKYNVDILKKYQVPVYAVVYILYNQQCPPSHHYHMQQGHANCSQYVHP